MDIDISVKQERSIQNRNYFLVGGIIFVLLCSSFFGFINSSDKDFVIHVGNGNNLSSITEKLVEEKIIKNEHIFKAFVMIFKSDRQISTGDYLFKKNSSLIKIAWQLSRGQHNIDPIKITLKEGITKEVMSKIFSEKLSNFDSNFFIENTKEGYLFPDTYMFYPLTSTGEVISTLENNFKNKTLSINSTIVSSGKSFSDIIIMASIIEKEAHGKDDASIISGILWKRINLGMPLQVDVDLSTYKTKGLPSKPINNPGIVSIKASASPETSNYLFYLHDKNGIVHFAKTYDEHRLNISKYLK